MKTLLPILLAIARSPWSDGGNTVTLTAGNSTLVTGDLADTISVTAGNNNITAGGGNDTITLGSGNDTVDAGAGTDTVSYSVSKGTWSGSITDAETVTATYTGNATIDVTNVSGYDTLNVTASADTVTTTLNNIGSATINLSDDNTESGGTGDLETMVIDTTDDAVITVDLGANLNASTSALSNLTALTVTDASSVTLKTSGGSFGTLLSNDFATTTLDDEETTSVTVISADYSSAEAALAGTESVATYSVQAEGIESDLTLDANINIDAMTSITLTADGLNSTINQGKLGDAETGATANLAILDSITISASNGSTIDFNNGSDTEEGDINSQGGLTSYTISASGEGSTVESGTVDSDGDEFGTVSYTASDGATIDTAGAESGKLKTGVSQA